MNLLAGTMQLSLNGSLIVLTAQSLRPSQPTR
jgi:hypothetical protein